MRLWLAALAVAAAAIPLLGRVARPRLRLEAPLHRDLPTPHPGTDLCHRRGFR